MSAQDFILRVLEILVPAIVTLHLKQPWYMKKPDCKDDHKCKSDADES